MNPQEVLPAFEVILNSMLEEGGIYRCPPDDSNFWSILILAVAAATSLQLHGY
jgi:hypothetical protein